MTKETTEINCREDAEFYNYCKYTLSDKDFASIKRGQEYIKNDPKIFSITYRHYGNVELNHIEEDNNELLNTCRIDYSYLVVYDTEVYLQMTEKYSGEVYEIELSI